MMNMPQTLFQKLTNRVVRFSHNRRFQQALKSSHSIFANQHPDWVDAGFDWHFLTHRAAPLITQLRDTGAAIAAEALANQWADQYTWTATRRTKMVARSTVVTEEFLYILTTELAGAQFPSAGSQQAHAGNSHAASSLIGTRSTPVAWREWQRNQIAL